MTQDHDHSAGSSVPPLMTKDQRQAEAAKIAIYTCLDDAPEAHRYVGYFYWPSGEVANVVFRGPEPVALRAKIAAFAEAQLEAVADERARRAEAAEKRRTAKIRKASELGRGK